MTAKPKKTKGVSGNPEYVSLQVWLAFVWPFYLDFLFVIKWNFDR